MTLPRPAAKLTDTAADMTNCIPESSPVEIISPASSVMSAVQPPHGAAASLNEINVGMRTESVFEEEESVCDKEKSVCDKEETWRSAAHAILLRMLTVNPNNRPSCSVLMQDPFFGSLYDPDDHPKYSGPPFYEEPRCPRGLDDSVTQAKAAELHFKALIRAACEPLPISMELYPSDAGASDISHDAKFS